MWLPHVILRPARTMLLSREARETMFRMPSMIIAAIVATTSSEALAQTPLGIPNTGNAPPSGPPIQIEDCVAGGTGGAIISESDRRFKVVFTNEGRIAADLIKFRIDFGTESLAIRDVGTFAPGVTITHVFKKRGGNIYASPLFAPAKLRCSVDAVHFKDGSEWSPPAATASATRATSELSGNGWIGVQMDQTPQGVVAHLVIPAGPARAAGMMQGDIIQKVDDQHVTTVADALILISSVEPGAQLKITVLRGDGQHDLLVVVGRRPQ